jgi:hypothetical protein
MAPICPAPPMINILAPGRMPLCCIREGLVHPGLAHDHPEKIFCDIRVQSYFFGPGSDSGDQILFSGRVKHRHITVFFSGHHLFYLFLALGQQRQDI